MFDGFPSAHVLKSLYLPYMRCIKSVTPQDFWFCFIIFLYVSNIFCTLKLMHTFLMRKDYALQLDTGDV